MSAPENVVQNDWRESMLGEFLDESGQLLDRLNENLLQLDAWVQAEDAASGPGCNETLLNEMFRSAHSLKGLSGMLGLGEINSLTHRLENVFDAARKEGLPVTGDVVELMFQAVDQLQKLVEGLRTPPAEPIECGAIIEEIRRLLASHGVERKQSSQADAERALAEIRDQAGVAPPAAAAAPATTPPQSGETPVLPAATGEQDYFASVTDDASAADKYVPIFIDEAGLSLDRFAETLLAIENRGSAENLKTLLHVAHQVKGSAACVGLKRPAKLAHLMEDLLQNLVDSGSPLSPQATDALLKCSDALRQYLENLKQGRVAPDGFGPAAAELIAAQSAAGAARAAVAEHPPAASADVHCGAAPQLETHAPAGAPGPTAGICDELRRRVAAAAHAGTPCLVGRLSFQPMLPMVGLKAQLVYNKLANLGEVCYFDPPPPQLDELEVLEGVAFGLATDKPDQLVRDQLSIAGVAEITIEMLADENASPPAAKAASAVDGCAAAAAAGSSPPAPGEHPDRAEGAAARGAAVGADGSRGSIETLRVGIEQLDSLMNLAGQLVISKARFAQCGERLKALRSSKRWMQTLTQLLADLTRLGAEGEGQHSRQAHEAEVPALRRQARRCHGALQSICEEMRAMDAIPDSLTDLFEAIHQLDRVSDAVQQGVMDTRMVPIGPLFNRFKRVIRDLTRTNGKEVRLVICGEKTKLDKRMIDELGDPLIHMVRNAADHGIEAPEARAAAGKPREGTVTLDAFHRGNHVVIQVRDDGAGLNTERIRRKCLEKGLLTEAEAQKMTPHQIHQFIWAPGLSTAEKVTEVSGRGMGMDIVMSKIELLHGTVDLQSDPGQGTLISIKLPLTLAIQPSLLVDIGGDVFAMPMESVLEIVCVPRKELSTVHGHCTAWVRQRAISVVDLDHVFQWTGGKPRRQAADSDDVTIVIVGEGKSELGLEVDCVLGEQDAVVKSINENYRNVAGITGASILGDGRVSLILDVAALIQMAAARPAAPTLVKEPLCLSSNLLQT